MVLAHQQKHVCNGAPVVALNAITGSEQGLPGDSPGFVQPLVNMLTVLHTLEHGMQLSRVCVQHTACWNFLAGVQPGRLWADSHVKYTKSLFFLVPAVQIR
jgi:hypothetical protein